MFSSVFYLGKVMNPYSLLVSLPCQEDTETNSSWVLDNVQTETQGIIEGLKYNVSAIEKNLLCSLNLNA
jgi:hypothetical protein